VTNRSGAGATARLHRTDRFVERGIAGRGILGRPRPDDGFVLLETVIAIGLISVVMAAFTTFFVNTVTFTSVQRATQAATQIADSAVETIRALPASDLLTGHDATSVSAQFSGAPAIVKPWLLTMTQATDPLATVANSGETAAISTAAVARPLGSVAYSVNSYLGTCVIQTGVTTSATCGTGTPSSGTSYLRAVVAVSWPGTHCPSPSCVYVTATLLSTASDPTFNLNAVPPAVPVLTNPGNQTSVVGDAVNLPLAIAGATGVPPFTWAVSSGTLPLGLVLSPASGLISGPTAVAAASTPITVSVTDGFGRTASTTFNWTVAKAVAIAQPANQATFVGMAAVPLTLTASGGTGSPYSWTDPNRSLPPGLSISRTSGQVSGTPTAVGVYQVVLTAADSTTTHDTTVTFTWTVANPPIAAIYPGSQTSTLSTPDSLQLTATGGLGGGYTWADPGGTLPSGFTISTGGLVTGTPTILGTKSVSLTVTDGAGGSPIPVPFTWNIVAKPTVTAPPNSTLAAGSTLSYQVQSSCPNSPCTYSFGNPPGVFSIDGSGGLTGTVTTTPGSYPTAYLTVTDNSGATGTSGAFTITVTGPTSPPNSLVASAGDAKVTASWAAPTNLNGFPVTSYTVTASPGTATCTVSITSCTISGLTNGLQYTLTVSATSSAGTSAPSAAVKAIPYPAFMSSSNGMTLWLDGADPSALFTSANCSGGAATATIGCWKDKSGRAENFVQTTVASQPTVGAWNNLPAATFSDTNRVLNSANAVGTYRTVFVAANLTGSPAVTNLFGNANQDFNVRVGAAVNRLAPNSNDWSFNTTGGSKPLNWTNGVQAANTSTPAEVITSDQSATLKTFATSVSNTFLSRGVLGSVGEVITFNIALTAAQRLAIDDYLAVKWGVAVTPDQPTSPTGVAGTRSVTVSWTAPAFDGGSPVTGYTVTASPGGSTCTTGGSTSCTVTGLTSLSTYTFTVSATNSVGQGLPSVASPGVKAK